MKRRRVTESEKFSLQPRVYRQLKSFAERRIRGFGKDVDLTQLLNFIVQEFLETHDFTFTEGEHQRWYAEADKAELWPHSEESAAAQA